jgi:hypothetical protein
MTASSPPSTTPPHVLDMGVFATASYAGLRMRKEQELAEIIFQTLQKLPKSYSKEYINDRSAPPLCSKCLLCLAVVNGWQTVVALNSSVLWLGGVITY